MDVITYSNEIWGSLGCTLKTFIQKKKENLEETGTSDLPKFN